jgi:hypothetical protein
MVDEGSLDPGEVAMLQHTQENNKTKSKTWKKLATRMGALKNPYRLKGRKFTFGRGGVHNAWTFLELCEKFKAFLCLRDARSRRESQRLKTSFHRYGREMSDKVMEALQLQKGTGSQHEIGEKDSLLSWLSQKNGTVEVEESDDEEDSAYTDEDFAILRHIMTEGNVSGRKLGIVFAGFWYFFKRSFPKGKHLVYRRTLKAKFMRLAHKDAMDIRAEVRALVDECDGHTISYMTDCSFYGEERLVSYFAYPKADMSGPATVFTGIGAIASKDAKNCAVAALDRLTSLLGEDGVGAMFSSCQDHAALNELKHFFEEAQRRNVPMQRAFEVCIKLGDDFHKLSLVDRAASNGAFGSNRGIGVHSHLQLLYDRHNIHTKKSSALAALKRDFMHKHLKKPPAPMDTRWATIGLAAIDFLDELEIESENPRWEGCYATPDMWKFVADTQARSFVLPSFLLPSFRPSVLASLPPSLPPFLPSFLPTILSAFLLTPPPPFCFLAFCSLPFSVPYLVEIFSFSLSDVIGFFVFIVRNFSALFRHCNLFGLEVAPVSVYPLLPSSLSSSFPPFGLISLYFLSPNHLPLLLNGYPVFPFIFHPSSASSFTFQFHSFPHPRQRYYPPSPLLPPLPSHLHTNTDELGARDGRQYCDSFNGSAASGSMPV